MKIRERRDEFEAFPWRGSGWVHQMPTTAQYLELDVLECWADLGGQGCGARRASPEQARPDPKATTAQEWSLAHCGTDLCA